jgi:hypothetical protein
MMDKPTCSPSTPRGPLALALPALLSVSLVAQAIELGQIDDFQDQTTMNWAHGIANAHAPRVVADQGPEGTGDHALAVSSSGGFGAGSMIVMFNRSQWTGDFLEAGVTAISFHLRHVSGPNASVRVALQGPGGRFATTSAIQVDSGTGWDHHTIDITPENLTGVGATGTAEQTLAAVNEMRLLSATNPSWTGDPVEMELHFDNILALGENGEQSPFEQWRIDNFEEDELQNEVVSGPFADPDGDGVANLLEFVLLGDPNTPTTATPPLVSVATHEGQNGGETFLTLTFTRREELGDIVLQVQIAPEPGAWSNDAVLVESASNGNGTITETWRDTTPVASAQRRFIRLSASHP